LIKFLKWGSCTAQELRTVDCLALILVLFVAQGCRSRITSHEPRDKDLIQRKDMKIKASTGQGIDWDAVHTAANICLFPPLFFFSGLYYTDVLSTCIVLGSYYHFLKHGEVGRPKSGDGMVDGGPLPISFIRGLTTYVIGLAALLMRQTNIFWVAIFLGGMEAVRCFLPEPTLVGKKDGEKQITYLENLIVACSGGAIHDPRLAEAAGLGRYF
jgi:alpha-1,2-glucosyltransferase